jgi:hypothetical protein
MTPTVIYDAEGHRTPQRAGKARIPVISAGAAVAGRVKQRR